MRRTNVPVLVLLMLITLGGGLPLLLPLRAQGTPRNNAAARPGDVAYTPTKLEWAALELQADYGNTNWTSETPVTIGFMPLSDGTTVLCLLQYTPDVTAQVVKVSRDSEQVVFDKYVRTRGWSWLRLQFQEKILPSR